jgi:peptide deformylase
MLELLKSNHPVLKQVATDWIFDHPDALADAEFMSDAMIKTMQINRGVGLAANQVGCLRRVFVMQPSNANAFALFNPKIVSVSEEMQNDKEGCLSFPDLWFDVERPNEVIAEYLDKAGIECKIKLTGLDARIFLHELEHLDGICFTSKISKLKLAMARKKQLKRGKK